MNDKAMQGVLGLSVVVLGYALYQHFKDRMPAGVSLKDSFGGIGFASTNPAKPDHGYGYDPYNPGEVILSGDLIKGTIADVYANQAAGDEIPTTAGLIASTVGDYYKVQERPGDFMRVGWW